MRTSERDLGSIIEAIPGLVRCAAPDGEVNYLNQRMLDDTGTTPGTWKQGWNRAHIARDLHDTPFLGFQGMMLRLQVVDDLLPPGKAKVELERTLQQGDEAIVEGQSAVQDLRLSILTTNDLARAVSAVAGELATDAGASFCLVAEGSVRERQPIGAKLNIWSGAGTGTEIELNITGSIAYRAIPSKSCRRGSWLSRALPLFLLAASHNIFGLDRYLTIAQF